MLSLIHIYLEQKAQKEFERAVMDQLIKDTEVEIPDDMLEYERDRLVENYNGNLIRNGLTLDQYISMMGTTMDEFVESMKDEAVHVIKNELILEAVARQEGLEVTDRCV